ncbi:MAG: alpha/beta hydrolase-fold protein [Thermoanaerobaculia bacterium]
MTGRALFRDYWDAVGRAPRAHRGRGELLISATLAGGAGGIGARKVQVYLPAGYHDGRDRFPVLLLNDGQNLFDEATSYAGSWHAEAALDRLQDLGRPVIAVGIPNAGMRRIFEYAPFRDRRYGGGGGEAYLAWLSGRVLPLVARNFRVAAGRETTALAGASMGGLISLYAAVKHPDRFGLAGAMSPSLFFGDEAMLRVLATDPAPHGRIYLDIGTLEGRRPVRRRRSTPKPPPKSPSGGMKRLRKVRRRLEKLGFKCGVDLAWSEEPGGRHDEAAWSRRLPEMLQFLFLPETPLK